MKKNVETFEYLFEASWEVCNKVGGIYTVLSTKARTMREVFNDKLIFIGPDLWKDSDTPEFIQDSAVFPEWVAYARAHERLNLKVGRWNIPGMPIVVLVDFKPFFEERDALFFSMWNDFQVDSLRANGDYDESCVFAYSSAKVIESFYRFYKLEGKRVGALFNEWMLGMGLLHVKKQLPEVATLFITHATSIGRSIAGNNKPLYAYMEHYNGDQMARELNMEAKHSVEKQAAHYADCFVTVSDITACEAAQLLERVPEVVAPNGFEPDFVPVGAAYTKKKAAARKRLTIVAEKLLGHSISPDALFVSTSGRYEYRNKGIDVFIEAMNRLRTTEGYHRETIAFILVPAWVRAARADLEELVDKNIPTSAPLQMPFITHWLNNMGEDQTIDQIARSGFTNQPHERVKIVFVPCYLDGEDGIFNKSYYDILIGMDATVYPSYYEPWGYTPLESIAFGIPTITTDLAGFGLWARKNLSGKTADEGVVVVTRTDDNYFDVVNEISQAIQTIANKSPKELKQLKKACLTLAKRAEWSKFIVHYYEAFAIAQEKGSERRQKK